VVVAFIGTACPINNAYAPRLAKLAENYESKGVQFIGINPNRIDSVKDVAAHQKKYEIPFPVLKDSVNKVSDLFGARRTPEVFVLDDERTIRYRGRIDDQFGYDFRRSEPTKNELADAIEALLAGKPVAVSETQVAGCLITRATRPKDDAKITYTKDVARIIQKNCQECHRPGQIGPMPLLTFEDVEGWSAMIQEVVTDRRMPPWYADPKIGHFLNDRSLPERDRETLLAWIDQGCARGDDKDAPPPMQFSSDWRIGKPDVIFTMAKPYDVPAEMPRNGIPYQYFVIETNFKEDMWVEKAEARPGAAEVVHHMIAFVVPPRKSEEPDPPGPPLLPPLVPESRKATVLCGTAPGDMPTILRPGYAKKVPKGAKIVLQMHYTPNGKAQKDRSSIGLIFAKKPPTHQVLTIPILNYRFAIPAGDSNYRVESSGPWDPKSGVNIFLDDVQIIGFMPHMHLRGKDFYVEAVSPGGKKLPLISIPRFNFNWQAMYQLTKPLDLPKGAQLHCVAHFDNSAGNPNNPDPTKTVRWGDQTWQEMMIGWTDIAVKRE
jgi:peroxiredoxin